MTGEGVDGLFDLTGKVTLVTGGSRGLRRQMVLAFAAHGADVVIASRKIANCEAVLDGAKHAGGLRGGGRTGDVAAARGRRRGRRCSRCWECGRRLSSHEVALVGGRVPSRST
jgi:NAD(P)-dependent dehydrogenase (short-subunit alcohol dehydrogenase family)